MSMRTHISALNLIARLRSHGGLESRSKHAAWMIVVLGIVVAVATMGHRRTSDAWPSAVVREAPLVETIVERGTLSAARMTLYGVAVGSGPSKIIEIVPEGIQVTAGDVLVRFDTSTLQHTLAKELAALRQAQADLARTREDLRLEQVDVTAGLDAARQQIGFAEAGLTNQLDGKGKVDVAEAEAAAAEAAREVARTRATVDDLTPMLVAGFVTRVELDRAEQAWQRAQEQARFAKLRVDALTRYERPAAVAKANADVHAAREEWTRARESASARMGRRRAAVEAAQSRVDETQARVALLHDQIARSDIRATGPGLVVYRDLFFGTDRRKPQLGDDAWPNQPILAVPDSSQLVVETRVREVDLHRITLSQRVFVRVDAYPDVRLPAVVSLVGALAQEDAARAGTKFFPVTITLRGSDARLRTGMTAQVEIQVASLERAIVVPVSAVFDACGRSGAVGDVGGSGDAPYCVVLDRDRPMRRPVKIAAENETHVAVASGVAPGEIVLLVDPTRPASSLAADRPTNPVSP